MCPSAGNHKASLETCSWALSWKTENKRAPFLLPMERATNHDLFIPGDLNADIFANLTLSLISNFAFACLAFYSLLPSLWRFPALGSLFFLSVSKTFAFFLKMLLIQSPIPSCSASQSLHASWEIKIKWIQDVNETYDPETIFALDIVQRI